MVAAVWLLWPASLGGHTRLIAVEGKSMEPTYHLGDAVIARTNATPRVGDIIIYHVPKGQPAAGLLIIHRVHAIWPDGTYQTQGDNRISPDQFHIASDDIVGSPKITLPRFGRFIGLSSSPLAIGGSSGFIAMLMLWPSTPKKTRERLESPEPDDNQNGSDQDHVDDDAQAWLETQLGGSRSSTDDRIEAEALAWLESELAHATPWS
jgi:signal peptidase